MRKVLEELESFALGGNVLELAVAVILGLAFNAVVQSLVDDVLMNLIAALFGQPTFDSLTFKVGEGTIFYGRFINALINFLLIALALFLMVKAFHRAKELRGLKTEPSTSQDCPYCKTTIPAKAQRCPNCTSQLQVAEV
jgi:large conductance mechanosensitive channel